MNPSDHQIPTTNTQLPTTYVETTTTTTPVSYTTYETNTGPSIPTTMLAGKHHTGRRYPRSATENGFALITGATSGIGLDLARMLVRDNWSVVIVARNQSKLAETKMHLLSINPTVNVVPMCVDLAQNNAADIIFQQLQAQSIPVTILINNAGVGDATPFLQQEQSTINNLLNLDVTSYVNLTHRLVPLMVQRGFGKILNVGSLASYMPGPNMTIYYASKAFILSFSEGLAQELKPHNISVTCLCPGGTRTNWFTASGAATSNLAQPANLMDCDVVAEKGYSGMMTGKGVVIPGFKNNAMVAGSKILPTGFLAKITKVLNRPKGQELPSSSSSSLPFHQQQQQQHQQQQLHSDYPSHSIPPSSSYVPPPIPSQQSIPSSSLSVPPSQLPSRPSQEVVGGSAFNLNKPLPDLPPQQQETYTPAK